MRAPSISTRLALMAAAVVAVAIGAFAMLAYFAVERTLLRGIDDVISGEIEEVEREVETHGGTREALVAAIAFEAEEHDDDLAFRALDPSGRVLAMGGALRWPPAHSDAWTSAPRETIRTRDDVARWRIVRRRRDLQGAGPVVIEGAMVLRDADRALAGLRRDALLAAPLVLVAALGAGWFLARRALGPVSALERAARVVGSGPPGARMPRSGAGDELDSLAATLDSMLERLEAAAARNLRFAGDVAHEVRNPLAALRVRIEALGRALAAGGRSPAAERVEEALTDADRMRALIDGLMLICRADEGGLRARFVTVDLGASARDAAEFFAPLAEESGAALAVEVDEAPLSVAGDPTVLGRAIANLVDNALRHAVPEMRPGTGGGSAEATEGAAHPLVTLRVRRVPGTRGEGAVRVRVEVEDDGPGVPEAARDRLFERFFRARNGSGGAAPEGAGLGLALVRSIALAHAGDAAYVPRPGGGSVFSFEVPALEGSAVAAACLGSSRPRIPASQP